MDFDLTHARHDPAHCLAPGLFRSLVKGERKKAKLDVTYHYGEHEQARFIGFEPLGADDLRFLQGLIALGGPEGFIVTPNPTSKKPKELRQLLDPKFDAVHQNALVVKTKISSLLHEVGLSDGGKNITAFKNSLLRMSNVTVVLTKGARQASSHLLSFALDDDDGDMHVCLNPRITEAILGKRAHTMLLMDEVRNLKTNPARLIHQRLCGWINASELGRVQLDTLCEYVWPKSTNPNSMRRRRSKVRKTVIELENVGWTVNEYAQNKYELTRPNRQ